MTGVLVIVAFALGVLAFLGPAGAPDIYARDPTPAHYAMDQAMFAVGAVVLALVAAGMVVVGRRGWWLFGRRRKE